MILSGNEFAKWCGDGFGNSLMVCALATFESGHHSVNKRANFAIIQQCAVTILIGLVGSEALLSYLNALGLGALQELYFRRRCKAANATATSMTTDNDKSL